MSLQEDSHETNAANLSRSCSIILRGYFNGTTKSMESGLTAWLQDAPDSASRATIYKFVRENPFIFVNDDCFKAGTQKMSKGWRNGQTLKTRWYADLVSVFGVEKMKSVDAQKVSTYGDLLNKLRNSEE